MLGMNDPPGTTFKELSGRLVLIFAVLVAWSGLLFLFKEQLFTLWTRPLANLLPGGRLSTQGHMPALTSLMRLSLMTAFFPALPLILYHVWRFLENGRAKKKHSGFFPFLSWTSLVFYFGAVLCYFFLLPPVARSFLAFASDAHQTGMIVAAFLPLAEKSTLALGVACALPFTFYFLGKGGMVGYRDLAPSRRYAVVTVFLVAALFTPPDLVTLWMLGVPMVIVCELCFQAVRISEKKMETDSSGLASERDALRVRSRCMLALFALVVLGFAFLDGFPSLGMVEVVFIVLLPFLLEYVFVLFVAFRSSMIQGFFCFLIPFYAPYFVLGKGSLLFRGRRFTKVWAFFACLATLYGILRLAGII